MRRRARTYTVTVKTLQGKLYNVVVQAETFQLACKSAEAEFVGGEAVYYQLESELAGRCAKCGDFIEVHERYQTDRNTGRLKCADCK